MRQDESSLVDIVQAMQRVLRFAQDLSRDRLNEDEMRQSAILYQIMIVGEAVKRLSPEFRFQHSQVPWKQMAGMRDVLTHQYDEVDLDVVWEVVQSDIPQLLELIQPLLPKNDDLSNI
jgi:uncharacterized protein with HEPN domain